MGPMSTTTRARQKKKKQTTQKEEGKKKEEKTRFEDMCVASRLESREAREMSGEENASSQDAKQKCVEEVPLANARPPVPGAESGVDLVFADLVEEHCGAEERKRRLARTSNRTASGHSRRYPSRGSETTTWQRPLRRKWVSKNLQNLYLNNKLGVRDCRVRPKKKYTANTIPAMTRKLGNHPTEPRAPPAPEAADL